MSSGLSNRIRKIRESRNETMEEFGLNNFNPPASKGVVSNWENGYNKPNKQRLDIIASLGGITTDELLHGKLAEEVNQTDSFIKYLESTGLTIKIETIPTKGHEEEMIDDTGEVVGKSFIADEVSIEVIIQDNENVVVYNEEEFKQFQQEVKETINYNIWKKLNS